MLLLDYWVFGFVLVLLCDLWVIVEIIVDGVYVYFVVVYVVIEVVGFDWVVVVIDVIVVVGCGDGVFWFGIMLIEVELSVVWVVGVLMLVGSIIIMDQFFWMVVGFGLKLDLVGDVVLVVVVQVILVMLVCVFGFIGVGWLVVGYVVNFVVLDCDLWVMVVMVNDDWWVG